MSHSLCEWMTDNAELFRYAGELSCMREGAGKILLSGTASLFLAPLFRTLYPDAEIIGVDTDREALDEAAAGCSGMIKEEKAFQSAVVPGSDIAVSVLSIETLETRELTGYLYNIHDSLVEGGNLYLSFPSTDTFVFSPMKEEDAWYDGGTKIRMKRYQADDVVRALSMIGFDIRAIERDLSPDLGTVISLHAVRR